MFLVLLRFTDRKAAAPSFMAAHSRWVQQGFDDGVFLLAGGLAAGAGGAIVAQGNSMEAMQRYVDADPFVAEGIVTPEIVQITANRADPRLQFLLEGRP
nr:YciI family protein [uncultured Caldimonas sp.]